ncbi:MAG TPA: hypothetical protein VND22_09515 [Actinomycetota bacterium]|nr:hypothetical protein [Actinomycetota bacterium]
MARTYAKVVGVIVLLVGIAGLFMDQVIVFNSDMLEDIIHIVSGALLAYVGFMGSDSATKSTVTVIGAVYLLIGIIGFVDSGIFGLMPSGFDIYDNLLHLVLGALGLFAGMSGRTAATTG